METPITQFSRTTKFESHIMQRLRLAVSTGMLVAIASLSSSCIGNEGDVAFKSQAASTTVAGGDTRDFNGAAPAADAPQVGGTGRDIVPEAPLAVGATPVSVYDQCILAPLVASCDSVCLGDASTNCNTFRSVRSRALYSACAADSRSSSCTSYCPRREALAISAGNCPATVTVTAGLFVGGVPLSKPFNISAGPQHSCGIVYMNGSQQISCWGRNHLGQLGDGTNTDRSAASRIVVGLPSAMIVKQIATGGDPSERTAFSCAIVEVNGNGSIYCWGSNTYGELGIGGDLAATPMRNTAAVIATRNVMLGVQPIALAAGFSHVCASVEAGDHRIGVRCWGQNHHGQLGLGNLSGFSSYVSVPAAVQATDGRSETSLEFSLYNLTSKISAHGHHTCAESNDLVYRTGSGIGAQQHSLICWGENANGEIASPAASRTCGQVGDFASCQPLAGGSAGVDTQIFVSSGEDIPAETGVRAVGAAGSSGRMLFAVGVRHVCAADDAAIRCYGSNDRGQLGFNLSAPFQQSVPTTRAAQLAAQTVSGMGLVLVAAEVAELKAGNDFTCARLVNQSVYCWGWNVTGSLGVSSGIRPMSQVPVLTSPPMFWTRGFLPNQISISSYNSLLIWRGAADPQSPASASNRGLSTVFGVGRNDFGQLGVPSAGGLSLTAPPTVVLP